MALLPSKSGLAESTGNFILYGGLGIPWLAINPFSYLMPTCFTELSQTAQLVRIYDAIQASGGGVAPAPGTYDFIDLDPPSQPTTITYRNGGPAGVLVRTVTLTYVGTDVETVTIS